MPGNRARKVLCKGRTRIEQAVGNLKRFKRVTLRCEKQHRITVRLSHLRSA
jgi:hypothetical protein